MDDRGLKVGDIIEHGRWGRLIREFGAAHEQFERESTLEKVRAAEFPGKPSRLKGSFAFADFEQADRFQEWRWDNGSKQHLYEVVPVDPEAAYHLGYMLCIPPLQDNDPDEVSRAYWLSRNHAFGVDFSKESCREIVYDCPFQIIRVCHEPVTKEVSEAVASIRMERPSTTLDDKF